MIIPRLGRNRMRCKTCGMDMIVVLDEEDLDDGCRDGTLECDTCLNSNPRLARLTREHVLAAVASLEPVDATDEERI